MNLLMDYIMQAIKWNMPVLSPRFLFWGALVGLCLFLVLFTRLRQGKCRVRHLVMAMVLYVYVLLILDCTLIARPDYGYHNYNLELFWSYRRVAENRSIGMLAQILLNYLLYIPVGILFPLAFSRVDGKWTCLFGMGLSAAVEVSQLLFRRGLFEWDDILGNTLGVLIGYGVYRIYRIYRIFKFSY